MLSSYTLTPYYVEIAQINIQWNGCIFCLFAKCLGARRITIAKLLSFDGALESPDSSDMYSNIIVLGRPLITFIYLLGSLGDVVLTMKEQKFLLFLLLLGQTQLTFVGILERKEKHFKDQIFFKLTIYLPDSLTLSASIFFCLANFFDSFCFFFSFFDSLTGVCG